MTNSKNTRPESSEGKKENTIGRGLSTLSDEEKLSIIEKVRFENEIRQELSGQSKSNRPSLWRNPLIISLICLIMGSLLTALGAIVTGYITPLSQYKWKTEEWKRQNQLDTTTFRLKMSRDCLKEFNQLSSYTLEAYGLAKIFIDDTVFGKEKDQLTSGYQVLFIDFQKRRSQQIALVKSLMTHFSDQVEINQSVKDYLRNADNYIRDTQQILEIKACLLDPTDPDLRNTIYRVLSKKEIDRLYSPGTSKSEALDFLRNKMNKLKNKIEHPTQLNQSYDRAVDKIKKDIQKLESDLEKRIAGQ
ncbi:MAG TPA: hypothetical protein ENN18_01735 [Proteobacteria bacterium]|nr:hypothetical protein [Pseudomonadota bacterium]